MVEKLSHVETRLDAGGRDGFGGAFLRLRVVTGIRAWRSQRYLLALVAQFAALASGALTVRLASDLLGAVGFGEFSVARRVFPLLSYGALAGLGISLPRYMALGGPREAEKYVLGAVPIVVGGVGFLSLAAAAMPEAFASVLFGSKALIGLVWPVVISAAGNAAYAFAYACFCGHLAARKATLISLFCASVLPPITVLLSRGSAQRAVLYYGLGLGISGIAVVLTVLPRSWCPRFRAAKGSLVLLLRYGIPRLPGELALFGLPAVPTVALVRAGGLIAAGHLSFAFSILQLGGSIFSAIGPFLLPELAQLLGQGRVQVAKRKVYDLVVTSALASAVLALFLELVAGVLIRVLGGPGMRGAETTTRIVLVGMVPYVLYIILRNAIDAATSAPLNAAHLIVAMAALLPGCYLAGGSEVGCATALATSLVILGGLTLLAWRRLQTKLTAVAHSTST